MAKCVCERKKCKRVFFWYGNPARQDYLLNAWIPERSAFYSGTYWYTYLDILKINKKSKYMHNKDVIMYFPSQRNFIFFSRLILRLWNASAYMYIYIELTEVNEVHYQFCSHKGKHSLHWFRDIWYKMAMIDRNDLRHTQKTYKETTKIYAGQIQSQLPACLYVRQKDKWKMTKSQKC